MTIEEKRRLDKLELEVAELRSDVKEVLARLNRLDGGRTALLWLFGAVATVVGAAVGITRLWS